MSLCSSFGRSFSGSSSLCASPAFSALACVWLSGRVRQLSAVATSPAAAVVVAMIVEIVATLLWVEVDIRLVIAAVCVGIRSWAKSPPGDHMRPKAPNPGPAGVGRDWAPWAGYGLRGGRWVPPDTRPVLHAAPILAQTFHLSSGYAGMRSSLGSREGSARVRCESR
jgi:hypothetical protein